MELEIGSIYEGKVTGITKFGAFVLLPMGKSGMVHISEVANTFVDDINNYLKEGQTVTVKLIAIDPQGRINLSIKKALPQPEQSQRPQRPAGPRPAPRPQQAAPAPRAKSQPPVFA
ncbi:MAG: S1 RNA-binding domain-containing protein, partial [Clostridia bacterium]|nr:S1 RNA-binding domain-containing protein [Clostridia bacterium]